MKAISKITFLDENGEKFFGEGPARLLHKIEETGSLRAAAISMEMAYSKAMKLLKQAEQALGFPLTTRSIGGKDGGGSELTPEGRAWLNRYEAYHRDCLYANQQLYIQHFGNLGCVIMASGLGKRFGSNKLMADFQGHPLIQSVLSVTEKLFRHRVVVTRHPEVADYCRRQKIDVILHEEPYRSDTIRLGLSALGPDLDGYAFFQGDQPMLREHTVTALAHAAVSDKESIWQPRFDDTYGAPIFFPRWAYEELLQLPQGKGGSFIAKKYPERVHTIQVQDKIELKDVDCPEDLLDLLFLLRQDQV